VRNRSYIGDGVYASFSSNGRELKIELEQGRAIYLDKDVFHALMEFVNRIMPAFDPQCQLVEVPPELFDDVVTELKELSPVAVPRGTTVQ
jgi:hypothetical protein